MAELAKLDGSQTVHRMVNRCLAKCGRWNDRFRRVTSVPPDALMCKRCTRLDGKELECGCDISSATLHQDGKTAFCHRCGLDVKITRRAD
jgi:hypothetical protein